MTSFILLIPPPPRSALFPYTTLFRSVADLADTVVAPDKEIAVRRQRAAVRRARADRLEGSRGDLCRDLANSCALRSEEHTSELQSHVNLVCRLLLEKKKYK